MATCYYVTIIIFVIIIIIVTIIIIITIIMGTWYPMLLLTCTTRVLEDTPGLHKVTLLADEHLPMQLSFAVWRSAAWSACWQRWFVCPSRSALKLGPLTLPANRVSVFKHLKVWWGIQNTQCAKDVLCEL